MPRHSKRFSPVSERMPSPYRAKRTAGHYHQRGADLLKFVVVGKVEESFGACKNSTVKVKRNGRQTTKCKSYRVILGNGLCQDCWDKEIDSRANNNRHRRGFPKIPEDSEGEEKA